LAEPSAIDEGLRPIGELAAGYVDAGMRIGLGTGRAASAFVSALGLRVREGLDVVGVPTSEATRRLAESVGIPLTTLETSGELDLTVDGADEVDPRLDLIKGLGGALVREKIVAASSKRLVILVGGEKLVPRLGVKTPVPVEVVTRPTTATGSSTAGSAGSSTRARSRSRCARSPASSAPGSSWRWRSGCSCRKAASCAC
jgi:ribose 5-phosphate isomerase A